MNALPPLPSSWSGLTWQQLCAAWDAKRRYGGNAGVARPAALLSLLGLEPCGRGADSRVTGEPSYLLRDASGALFTVTPRGLAHMAERALPWFDFPYGDRGEDAVRDGDGKVVKEARDPVRGYVSPMRDAMIVPVETLRIGRRHFALPQAACSNITWQQYRSLQAIEPMLWEDGLDEDRAVELQAQFLAHALTPRSLALLDAAGGSVRLRFHYEYRYDADRAEGLAEVFARALRKDYRRGRDAGVLPTVYHVCMQAYQTALSYYAAAYPLLFQDSGKGDTMKDALAGEVGTINTVMKYAGYAEQQQVYDSNLPFVLDILNTMTKEAQEIERMNGRIKKRS